MPSSLRSQPLRLGKRFREPLTSLCSLSHYLRLFHPLTSSGSGLPGSLPPGLFRRLVKQLLSLLVSLGGLDKLLRLPTLVSFCLRGYRPTQGPVRIPLG